MQTFEELLKPSAAMVNRTLGGIVQRVLHEPGNQSAIPRVKRELADPEKYPDDNDARWYDGKTRTARGLIESLDAVLRSHISLDGDFMILDVLRDALKLLEQFEKGGLHRLNLHLESLVDDLRSCPEEEQEERIKDLNRLLFAAITALPHVITSIRVTLPRSAAGKSQALWESMGGNEASERSSLDRALDEVAELKGEGPIVFVLPLPHGYIPGEEMETHSRACIASARHYAHFTRGNGPRPRKPAMRIEVGINLISSMHTKLGLDEIISVQFGTDQRYTPLSMGDHKNPAAFQRRAPEAMYLEFRRFYRERLSEDSLSLISSKEAELYERNVRTPSNASKLIGYVPRAQDETPRMERGFFAEVTPESCLLFLIEDIQLPLHRQDASLARIYADIVSGETSALSHIRTFQGTEIMEQLVQEPLRDH